MKPMPTNSFIQSASKSSEVLTTQFDAGNYYKSWAAWN